MQTSISHRSTSGSAFAGAVALAIVGGLTVAPVEAFAKQPVTYKTFVRAETDMTMKRYADLGAFGRCLHLREPTPIDKQNVIRMNRDTLYSMCIFDLNSPVTITKPKTPGRFQSLLVINQDHSMLPVIHGPAKITLTKQKVGTRYVFIAFRTFVDANSKTDIKAANKAQDAIKWQQKNVGKFEVPDWDEVTLKRLREAVNVLGQTTTDVGAMFGDKKKLNPIDHLIGTGFGWGGNPKEAAMYQTFTLAKNDGLTPHSVTVKNVPVDGFWSVTVYNAKGYMEKNDRDIYSYNNVTAKKNKDGSITINFGGCDDGRVNCIPIAKGWNTTIRLYRPRKAILDGKWKFPAPTPTK